MMNEMMMNLHPMQMDNESNFDGGDFSSRHKRESE